MAAADGASLPDGPPAASDIASYLHTGGTTGTPKLAARTHANEVSNAWMTRASNVLDQDSVIFAALPLFHTNALLVTVLGPLLKGQHVVWAGPLGYRDVPLFQNYWKIVERYRITAMSGVPTIYAVLAQIPVDADISSLKLPIVGAAPLPPAVATAFEARTGVRLCQGYGLTEGTCASSLSWPEAPRPGTVGQRLPYQQARTVRIDEATGEWTLPAGERGRDARLARPEHLCRLPRPRRLRPRTAHRREGQGRLAGHRRPGLRRRRTGSLRSPAAPRT